MAWLSVISSLLSIIRWIAERLHDQGVIDAAHKEVLLGNARDSLDAIDRAREARQAADAATDANPDGLRKPDEFERKD